MSPASIDAIRASNSQLDLHAIEAVHQCSQPSLWVPSIFNLGTKGPIGSIVSTAIGSCQ